MASTRSNNLKTIAFLRMVEESKSIVERADRRAAGAVTCTKTGSKNDPFLNCRRKPKELSKKELSNVAPASDRSTALDLVCKALSVPLLRTSLSKKPFSFKICEGEFI